MTVIASEPDLVIHAGAEDVAVDEKSRTITGLIVPFGILGSTNAGKTLINAGAITWSAEPRRVKLLREHQAADSVGWAAELVEGEDGITATFTVPEGDNGDRALAEASNGIRDGLSVGIYGLEGAQDADKNYVVKKATLREVSLVSIPAFDDARVSTVKANLFESTEMTETKVADESRDAELTELRAGISELTNTVKSLTDLANNNENGVKANVFGPNGTGAAEKNMSLTELSAVAAEALQNRSGNAAQVINAALSDVVPANATTLAWTPNYATELLGEVPFSRNFINRAVTTKAMPANGTKVIHPKWVTKPTVGAYAGNKAEVPSNSVSMTTVEFNIERWASAHDVDRVFIDRADPAFIQAFLVARAADYQKKTNQNAVTKAVAGATVLDSNAGTAGVQGYADLLSGIKAGVKKLAANGYDTQYVAVSTDLIDAMWGITNNNAPAWFNGQFTLANGGSGEVGGIAVFVEAQLPSGTFIVGNKSGFYFHEQSPIEVQALNIPNGGVDLGVFGYTFTYVADQNALAVGTVGA